MAENLQPMSVRLTGGISSQQWTPNQPRWAQRWGRTMPAHPPNGTIEPILGEVRAGVYSADINGVAYGSETVWARVRFLNDLAVAGDDEKKEHWIGVPATLPAGYTQRLNRNIGPDVDVSHANEETGLTPFQPVYAPSGFLRTPSGLYTPLDNSGLYSWGPWNRDNRILGENEPAGGAAWVINTGLGFALGPTSSGATMDYFQFFAGDGSDQRKHPGFRSVRAFTMVTPQFYNGVTSGGFPYPQYDSSTATFGMSAAGTKSISCARADLTYDATQNYWVKDHGNLGDMLCPLGDVGIFDTFDYVVNYPTWGGPPSFASGIGMSIVLFLVPRVDIPFPFFASYGNECAPGGVLTGGNVPGY